MTAPFVGRVNSLFPVDPASTVKVAFPEFEANVSVRLLEVLLRAPDKLSVVFASLVPSKVSERTVMTLLKNMAPTLVVPEIVTLVVLADAGAEPPLQFVATDQLPEVVPVQVWPLAGNGEASRANARAAARARGAEGRNRRLETGDRRPEHMPAGAGWEPSNRAVAR